MITVPGLHQATHRKSHRCFRDPDRQQQVYDQEPPIHCFEVGLEGALYTRCEPGWLFLCRWLTAVGSDIDDAFLVGCDGYDVMLQVGWYIGGVKNDMGSV